ncbi:carbohydrate-binding module family 1 protein [Diplodia corticola]|uniref:Carbohydrate-binding module family 1 protein n=1 Tax=Diplodia corticola TaxID=236234 RepID=A0A1J9RZE7_9PEZI|nr:carbohydrate-binding module family 1 protein [Diplodia corticola]OJD33164.1 carbohydrate-binding module family 1 protein [Diplodia corticola]
MRSTNSIALFFAAVAAGEVLWDGRFTADTASELSSWSWSNQNGAYQYYIHGSGDLTDYVNTGADFKNPADSASAQGAKVSIDSTSQWNGGGMLRTELIPQTDAAINEGTVYYHFSMMRKEENAPNAAHEHQVNFFESHFTEMKYGLISGASGSENTALQWFANSESQWNVTFEPGVWHNVAYEIDFSGGSVTFWHSTGADALTKTAGPVSVSASSNGADWHLGVLRLEGNTDATAEDWYFSGVYIESGDLTTEIGSGSASSSSGSSSSASPAAAVATSSSSAAASSASSTTTSAAVAAQETTASVVSSTPAAVATPTTLQTVASSAAAASSSAAAQPTGQTGSVPAEGNGSSTTTSGNGLSADEQEEVNQGISSWFTSLKAWWSANQ